jgi:hypothetical protein
MLGKDIGGFPYFIEIDRRNTADAVGADRTPALLQMVNPSCNPNCKTEAIDTDSGVPILVLEAIKDIAEGEEITIDYDARASPTSKQQGLTFWQWRPPTSSVRKGLHRIKCGCAGPGRTCPNRLWRDESVDITATRVRPEINRATGTRHHSSNNGQEHLHMGSSSRAKQRGDTVHDRVERDGTELSNTAHGNTNADAGHGDAVPSDERDYVEQGNAEAAGKVQGSGRGGAEQRDIGRGGAETGSNEHSGAEQRRIEYGEGGLGGVVSSSVNRGPTAQTGIVTTTPKVAAGEEEDRPATNAANNVTLL